MIVCSDRNNLRVRHSDRGIERCEFEMLLVLLWAIMTAGERKDQRIVALKRAELAQVADVIRQLIVWEKPPPGAMSERIVGLL